MLDDLIQRYQPEALKRFLQRFPNYAPGQDGLGEFEGLPIWLRKTPDATRYRSLFKGMAEEACQQGLKGALVVLHDPAGNYRFGYVELLYRGRRKPLPSGRSILIRAGAPNKTARSRLGLLLERASREENLTLEALREALSVDAISEEFYREFARLFENALVPEVRGLPEEKVRDFLLGLVARTLFLAFVAKRGWLGGREDFLPWLLEAYSKEGLSGSDRFYPEWLAPLFFGALKGPPGSKGADFAHLPEAVRRAYQEAPYLNGELFQPKAGLDEEGVLLSDGGVKALFDFLFAYNFTIEENTAYEVDLELNPEFLGLILERLVNTVGVEGKATELGAHYTPRVEVDLMVRLGLAELLHRKGLPLERAYALMEGEAEALGNEEKEQARKVLLEAKILDPAVGSGAFPVGVLQVLEETLDRLGEPRTLDRKKRLLQNLHGVDVLSWAVWMAELRLWLAYFLELPDSAKCSREPLLPSLGLKVVQGDSAVQRVEGRAVPTRLEVAPALQNQAVQKALSELLDAKQGYFHNRGVKESEVRQKEAAFLQAVLEAPPAEGLQGGLLVKGQAEELDEQMEALKAALKGGSRPFLYLVDFAEVLVGEGGFDLVIGNPPYVRQEEIRDVLGRFGPGDYKNHLQEETRADLRRFPGLTPPAISGRSDLYTYFYARTLALLKPTGVHVFIASNSWLDVQYGAWLQEVFLRAAPLRFVIENRVKRSFRADVNVAISVAWAPEQVKPDWKVRFLAVEAPFEEADLLGELRKFWGRAA
ncbi:Eco57I restriction-modification methylase domain-containing protein [Thermus sp.]|uniref:Eco57I restriction-modification methylase domain-containing protein n=1 Tax=Thermus sp. TaxID=275 RepID=UPI002600C5FE|nr:Eco57I restriction-modification methylase domain-containing protein [Thermus sp.]MCS6869466.1 Eco57I restriction-modification methylase domain-containing protein [Thermus sp.]